MAKSPLYISYGVAQEGQIEIGRWIAQVLNVGSYTGATDDHESSLALFGKWNVSKVPRACLFRFEPVFVNSKRQIDPEASRAAVVGEATGDAPATPALSPADALEVARRHLDPKSELWWEDEVEFIGMSWTEFV